MGILMEATKRFVASTEGTILPRERFYARDEHRANELELFGCAKRVEDTTTEPATLGNPFAPPVAPPQAPEPTGAAESPDTSPDAGKDEPPASSPRKRKPR